jgi:hypothetical protein
MSALALRLVYVTRNDAHRRYAFPSLAQPPDRAGPDNLHCHGTVRVTNRAQVTNTKDLILLNSTGIAPLFGAAEIASTPTLAP